MDVNAKQAFIRRKAHENARIPMGLASSGRDMLLRS